MRKKLKSILMLSLVGVLFLVFAVGSTSSSDQQVSGNSTNNLELVEVTSAHDDGYSSYYIEGTIKNNSDKQFSYVEVTFNLYDADGAQIGTAMDNLTNLEGNGTWKFKALGLATNGKVASYKLLELKGW